MRTRVVVLVTTLAAVCAVTTPAAAATPTAQRVIGAVGTVWDQHTLDSYGDAASVARGAAVLDAAAQSNTQALMGWGASDPEPARGVYSWASLDSRVRVLTARRGAPVMMLCCSPAWMRGDPTTATDWSGLTKAPQPSHFRDFAALAAKAAARYPKIRYFNVWNELKGFWNPSLHRWNYEAYTQLYNDVYDAVKKVRPDAQIGGPYVVIDSYAHNNPAPSGLAGRWGSVDQRDLDVVRYWLAHKHGASYLALDISTATRDAGVIADPQTMTGKITSVLAWARARTRLPIWFTEFSAPSAQNDPTADAGAQVLGLSAALRGGARMASFWGPEQQPQSACGHCLFTSTDRPGGGIESPLGHLLAYWGAAFRGKPYQRVRTVASGVYAIEATTSAGGSAIAWILVNTRSTPSVVSYGGKRRVVAGYAAVTSSG